MVGFFDSIAEHKSEGRAFTKCISGIAIGSSESWDLH